MRTPVRRLRAARLDALLVLAAAGAAISAYLSWVALAGHGQIACGPLGDCETVQDSQYADVAGVPVALLGLGMYAALLLLVGLRRFAPEVRLPLAAWTFTLALGGTLYSAYLTYLELFVIDAICAWCVASAAAVTAMLLLSLPDLRSRDGGRRSPGASAGRGADV